MSPLELRAWRDRHGLSNAEAARVLGVSPSGFLKKLYGQRPIRRPVERAIENIDLLRAAALPPSGWPAHYRRHPRFRRKFVLNSATAAEIRAIFL